MTDGQRHAALATMTDGQCHAALATMTDGEVHAALATITDGQCHVAPATMTDGQHHTALATVTDGHAVSCSTCQESRNMVRWPLTACANKPGPAQTVSTRPQGDSRVTVHLAPHALYKLRV